MFAWRIRPIPALWVLSLLPKKKTGEGENATVNTAILPNAQFTGAGDADGNVEISYKI